MLKGIDQIYIAHYSPLIERKIHIQSELNKYNLSAIFVEDEPSQFEISKYYSKDQIGFYEKAQHMPDINTKFRELKNSEISVAWKHIKIFNLINENHINTSLILEDDVILENNFIEKLNNIFCDKINDWDIIFIGSGCNLHIDEKKINEHQFLYHKEHPASRCADSYIIKRNAAIKILSTITPFHFAYDWELNFHMKVHDLKVYWAEPSLISQGSQDGKFNSSIQ